MRISDWCSDVCSSDLRGTSATFLLVAAMNPFPCWWLCHKKNSCRCTPDGIESYRNRLSGPFLDRLDLQIASPPAEPGWVDLPEGEPSAAVRQRVLDCRARQWRRQVITNARPGPDEIQPFCPLDQEGKNLKIARAQVRARVCQYV